MSATEVNADSESMSVKVRQEVEDSRLNLILAGFPKCGTTSFAHWLGESPLISVSNPKETFLLCSEHHRPSAVAREGSLTRCFAGVEKPLRLEASTRNVYSQVLLNEVRSLGHVKIILSFRDPLEAVVSWHNQLLQGGEACDPELQACWRRSIEEGRSPRAQTSPHGERLRLVQNYALVCEFGYWMDKWKQAVGDERLLLVDALELQGGCEALRARLNAFCQADLQLSSSPPVLNSYASIRFESFYKKFKHSFLNQRLRDVERWFPRASAIRRTVKEKFFRKSVNKGGHDTLKAELREYYAADIELSRKLYFKNKQFWESRAAESQAGGLLQTRPGGNYQSTNGQYSSVAGSQGRSK